MCILKTKYLFNNLLMSPTVLFTPKTSVKFPINPILKIKFLSMNQQPRRKQLSRARRVMSP